MVVSVENIPPSLRGRLAVWLIEIRSGIYVGVYSVKVREYIWDTIEHSMGKSKGNVIMIWKDSSEFGFSMRTIGKSAWTPVEIDGLKLIAYDSMSLNTTVAKRVNE